MWVTLCTAVVHEAAPLRFCTGRGATPIRKCTGGTNTALAGRARRPALHPACMLHFTHFREGVTSAAAARGISMLVAAAAVRPAVNCRDTGLLSFWALQQQQGQHVVVCCGKQCTQPASQLDLAVTLLQPTQVEFTSLPLACSTRFSLAKQQQWIDRLGAASSTLRPQQTA